MLVQLNDFNRSKLLLNYRAKKHIFPLIASVLEGSQGGTVYCDGQHDNYFVIHKFGFADIIENQESPAFDACLYHFISEKKFINAKLRWYEVPEKWISNLEKIKDKTIQMTERVQLMRDSFDPVGVLHNDEALSVEQVTEANFDVVETNFNLSLGTRFWSSKQQFLNKALAVLIKKQSLPAALCYACALENNVAEVDVFTQEGFRGQGLGKLATAEFINNCVAKGLKVHWDCYSNNTASFSLAKALGFKPYNFYAHAIIGK